MLPQVSMAETAANENTGSHKQKQFMEQLTSHLKKISNNATLPTENDNCRKASMKGIDSMSPKNKKYKSL